MKYLESVHNNASFYVTKQNPAEPSKSEIKAILSSALEIYSLFMKNYYYNLFLLLIIFEIFL